MNHNKWYLQCFAHIPYTIQHRRKAFSYRQIPLEIAYKTQIFFLNMLHYSVTCHAIDWSKQHNLRQQHFSESSYCIFSIFDHRYCQCHSISTHLIALVTMEFVKVMYWNSVTLTITMIEECKYAVERFEKMFFSKVVLLGSINYIAYDRVMQNI